MHLGPEELSKYGSSIINCMSVQRSSRRHPKKKQSVTDKTKEEMVLARILLQIFNGA